MTDWGQLLVEVQAERGISTRQLSIRSGVARSTIKRFKHGGLPIRIDTFERLVAVLGYELDLLEMTPEERT